jgi:hypothetical protein
MGLTGEALYGALDDLRKAGLLNIYAKAAASPIADSTVAAALETLTDIRSDRLIGVVGPRTRERLEEARATGGLSAVSGALHSAPPGFNPLGSFKTKESYANLQLTLYQAAPSSASREGEMRAALEIDDANGIAHVFQVPRTALTRTATHPYDIHQLLVSQHIDPMYRLGR